MKKFRLLCLLILCALMLVPASIELYAEEPAKSLNSSGVENRVPSVDPVGRSEGFSAVLYDNTNGLPTSEANTIAETRDGFIWIGSYAGLIRYDGNTFERLDSTGGLTSVKCLYVDSKDRLWIGTNDNGVACMDKDSLQIWGKLDGMKSSHIRAITEGEDGTIYIATTNGIALMDPELHLSFMEEKEIADANMRDLKSGIDGFIYGVTDLGDLMMIRDKKLLKYISIEESPLHGAGTIFPDPEVSGRIYHEAVDFGLYLVDLNDGFNIINKYNVDPLRYIKGMEYIDDKLWICAGNGIGVLDNGRFHLLENLPMNNNVCGVMTDYLGDLWFTSSRQGVMKVVPNQFSDLFERYGLSETVVNSTCLSDGKLFVGTDMGLIVLGDKGPLKTLPLTKAVTAGGKALEANDLIEMLAESRIRSVIRDSKDRIWISTWRSGWLLRYDHGELTAFTVEDGLLSDSLRAVAEGKDGRILVAVTGGVNVIEGDKIVASYGEEDGITNSETLTVAEGPNGDIYVGSNGDGIYVINDSGIKNINVEEGLPSDIIMRLKYDEARALTWIVASSGIAYMDADCKVTAIRRFPYNNNFDLFENALSEMWVMSSDGIYVVPAEELLANGEINPVHYGIENGLPCITTANSYSELTSDGDLYIAGSTGVCKVNIDVPFEDVNDLKSVVPYLEADGERIYPLTDGNFRISSDVQKLTIPSFVFNYSLSDPQVSYQLEGFDKADTTVARSDLVPLNYTNLHGGTYSFTMHLKDSMGRGDNTVSVQIVKEKAFYEQTWFFILLAIIVILLAADLVRRYVRRQMRLMKQKQEEEREQFEQVAEALAGAIDAKDKYTNGHSRRVADYSRRIAEAAGKSEEECNKIYFTALLHDVGKIGVPIEILSKTSRLTDEEFEQIKQHPVVGGQILSSIKKAPWLSIGARYHHERYNGRGYPEGLSGEDIPEIGRIIAVADAYDAMTSNRSYRRAIPQHIVREQIVEGIGTQFDPEYAKLMIHMIDLDTEYRMQETLGDEEAFATTSLRCESIYNDCTEGVLIRSNLTRISLCSTPDAGVSKEECLPSLILFDSLDGKVHPGEEENQNLLYHEYARIRLDGVVTEEGVRKTEVKVVDQHSYFRQSDFGELEQRYELEALRYRDHMRIRIMDEKHVREVTLALPDASRFSYISIGGERCYVHNIRIETDNTEIGADEITRIAEEISYIKDCPEGDVPNIQVDGWRYEATKGIPIRDSLKLRFHTMSLPTARLVWHCPFISVFTSEDGQVNGKGYREFILLRLDGETWESDEHAKNEISLDKSKDFAGWNVWKETNRKGMDCVVNIKRDKNRITIETENLGVAIHSVTTILDMTENVFIALTGDQCAITDIHVN